jgi:hypothetical protein
MRAVGRIVLVLSLVAVAGCGGSGKETPSVTSGRLATVTTTTTITIPPTPTTTITSTSTSTSTTESTTTTTEMVTINVPKHAPIVPIFTPSASPSGNCGGDLPPCWVMMRESRGQIKAENPDSSASGKWQILDSSWQLRDSQGNPQPFMGYWHAADAPEWVQDAKARTMPLCNWQPPNYCA